MDSRYVTCILVLMLVGCANSDIGKDKEECTNQLVGLATCLPYVGGEAKAPTPDCCSGLKQVLQKSKKCVCILVKDRNDPSLGLKINATLALGLPSVCHDPSNITASECVALLNLAPNSPEAKEFYDFVDSAKGGNSTTPAAHGGSTSVGSSSAEIKSKGPRTKRWLAVGRVCLVITSMVVPLLPNL